MYAKGLGVPVDVSESEKWYRKAAAQEDREAALTKELSEQEGKNGADQIYRVGDDVTAPKLLNRVEPAYPKAARRELIEGVVILEAIISASGNVTNIAVLKSVHPLIDEAAVHAVRQWRYSPATLNGNPVRVYLTVTMTFNLALMPPMPPRPRDSLFGNWQVPGQRICVWIGQDNRVFQCRITAADFVSKAAGIVEQTPEGKIIRWQGDWPSDSVRRDGDDLLLTSSEISIRFRPLDHRMAPSCGQK